MMVVDAAMPHPDPGDRDPQPDAQPRRQRRAHTDEEKAGVSLMVTQEQKAALRERGHDDDQIREMKPADAHSVLGIINWWNLKNMTDDIKNPSNRVDLAFNGRFFIAFWRGQLAYTSDGKPRHFDAERDAWIFLRQCDEAGRFIE
jgi:hypothetical protein